MSALDVAVFVVAVVVHAALATTQAALIASVPSRLNARIEDGPPSLRRLCGDLHESILALQTLTAFASIAVGVAVADSWWALLLGAVVLVITSLAVPQRSVPSPESTVLALAPFIGPLVALVGPLSRLVGTLAGRRRHVVSVDNVQLGTILNESRDSGLIDADDHELIAAVLHFENRGAAEVMVPVGELVVARRSDTVAAAEGSIVRSGHSRLLVIGDGPDEVLGFVHAKDLMALPASRRDRPIPFDVMRMVLVAEPTTPLGDLFASMRRARRHVVVISDAAGHTVGMVTMEDILEAIVGDIVDESDYNRGHVVSA